MEVSVDEGEEVTIVLFGVGIKQRLFMRCQPYVLFPFPFHHLSVGMHAWSFR